MVRKNRGLRNTDEVDYGKGGGGGLESKCFE